MAKLTELKAERARLDREIAAEENFEKRLAGNDAYAIADLLHDKLCHQNHVDGCGYEYETWSEKILVRKAEWLVKAHKLVELCLKEGVEPGKFVKKMLEIL